jgi:hypothetical protein
LAISSFWTAVTGILRSESIRFAGSFGGLAMPVIVAIKIR